MRWSMVALLATSLGTISAPRAEGPSSVGGLSLARASLSVALPRAHQPPQAAKRPKATHAQRVAFQGLLERERDQLAELTRLARDVLEAQSRLSRAGQHEHTLTYRRAEAERRLKALRKRQKGAEVRVRARLLRLYKLTRGRYARALAAAPSARERTRRARLLRYVVQRDLDELATFVRERRALEGEERVVAKEEEVTRLGRETLHKKREQLKRVQRAQHRALLRLSQQRRRKQRLVGALSGVSRKLMAQVVRSHRALKRKGFSSRHGSLRAPVHGRLLRAKDATARPGLVWRTQGRPWVRAVHAGVVRAARVIEGLGHVVLLEHGEGYFTLYGLLSSLTVKVGQKMDKHARLGRGGIDPLNGHRSLYFELRQGVQVLDAAAWF
ncbi:MAG: peptidoglycan DD-metalloendopeptidase family protein [Deltaproteobacteria bacterium]|nr:peptidoglycan DD-metalloendopeptidase family protein [Deltaproteobacteria bacterium]